MPFLKLPDASCVLNCDLCGETFKPQGPGVPTAAAVYVQSHQAGWHGRLGLVYCPDCFQGIFGTEDGDGLA